MRRLILFVAIVALAGVWWLRTSRSLEERVQAAGAALQSQAPDSGRAWATTGIQGIWEAERYLLAGGEVHPVTGRIVFGQGEWQVVFFVLDSMGVARRGSAEGGAYTVRGDTVTFRHRFNFSFGEALPGLPESPLRMEVTAATEAAREPTRFEIQGERLTLFFPSGNSMDFRRLEGPG